MEKVLSSVEEIGGFRQAWLYKHMTFQEMQPELLENMKKQLLQSFANEETYGRLYVGNRLKTVEQVEKQGKNKKICG